MTQQLQCGKNFFEAPIGCDPLTGESRPSPKVCIPGYSSMTTALYIDDLSCLVTIQIYLNWRRHRDDLPASHQWIPWHCVTHVDEDALNAIGFCICRRTRRILKQETHAGGWNDIKSQAHKYETLGTLASLLVRCGVDHFQRGLGSTWEHNQGSKRRRMPITFQWIINFEI